MPSTCLKRRILFRDGKRVAFAAQQGGQSLLYVMQADGTDARVVSDGLDLQGSPAWALDGRSILEAANDGGLPHLFRVPLDGGRPVSFVREYSMDPVYSPDGRFVVYSGPDIGTAFGVKAVTAEGAEYPMPELTLRRGGRHMGFLAGGQELVVLRGDIEHKNLWAVDLKSGAERSLTDFAAGFDLRDFDLGADARDLVLERAQERSDVVLMDLRR